MQAEVVEESIPVAQLGSIAFRLATRAREGLGAEELVGPKPIRS